MTIAVIYNYKNIILVNNKEDVKKLSRDFKFKISEYITRRYKVYHLSPSHLSPRYSSDTIYYLSCKFREIKWEFI